MSGLRLVPPPVTDELTWRRLLNFLYLHGRDNEFRWLQNVRAALEEAERREAA